MCRMRILLFDNLFSDPPPAVKFTAVQSFNEIVISWNDSLPDEPCPITNYTITINGSAVTVPGSDNQFTHPIIDECGSTVEISMFATSAAGSGETTATKGSLLTQHVSVVVLRWWVHLVNVRIIHSFCCILVANACQASEPFLPSCNNVV